MSNEEYVDNYLQNIIELDKYREEMVHSNHIRNFDRFDKGDRVSLLLGKIAGDGPYERVEAVLTDPKNALIDVKYVEGDLDWAGKTIGLAVLTAAYIRDKLMLLPRFTAGNQIVGYFSSENIEGASHVEQENIDVLALRYLKLTIEGAVIFDFTRPENP